ncbi:hypothetical protein K438DRAFT_1893005 [Mycena galopus ATCC 62051]|nr:hypothetical protein K438DRAFT_1893005 [Mycena galopus ATCC 62051]
MASACKSLRECERWRASCYFTEAGEDTEWCVLCQFHTAPLPWLYSVSSSETRTRNAAGLSNYELRGLTTRSTSRHATSGTERCWGRRVASAYTIF